MRTSQLVLFGSLNAVVIFVGCWNVFNSRKAEYIYGTTREMKVSETDSWLPQHICKHQCFSADKRDGGERAL